MIMEDFKMGLFGSILGGIAGALFGDKIGIAGFGSAINGSIPCAITGLVMGGLLEDKITTGKANQPIFPKEGTNVPALNISVRKKEYMIAELVCNVRKKGGLSEPDIDDYLSLVARYKAQDMAQTGKVEISSDTYGTIENMLSGFGISCDRYAIGIGVWNNVSTYAALESWMFSEEIYKTLATYNYDKVGVGYDEKNGCFAVIMIG